MESYVEGKSVAEQDELQNLRDCEAKHIQESGLIFSIIIQE